jgi:hypothetical protein
MAASGYPQMGQMPPMGGPMGAPPMGGPTAMQPPIRRGTSKAVPVVVSAGLAVGVFCGLLFGVGTGKQAAVAAPSSGSNVKKASGTEEEPKPDPGAAPKGLGATAAQPVSPPNPGSGSGSASVVAAAGSGTGSAAPAVIEQKKVIKLTFSVKPDAAAKNATITVDGKEINGVVTELPADRKSMKIEIKASGFRTVEKKVELVPGDEMSIDLEMQKKPAGGSGGVRPPKRPDRPTNAGPAGGGGLIDI